MPEDDTPEDETPVDAVPDDVVAEGEGETEDLGEGAMEDVPEADAAVQEDESLQSDEAFQSDEDCFKDAVAAEADQHKAVGIQLSQSLFKHDVLNHLKKDFLH